MPVPSSINDLSSVAGSNSPAGGETPGEGDNHIRALASFIAQLRDKSTGISNAGTLLEPNIIEPTITSPAISAPVFSGFPTGTVEGNTYTPTIINSLNVSSSTGGDAQWMRAGNVVTVSGMVDITPTSASTTTRLDISLPIASVFTNLRQCAGVGVRSDSTANLVGQVRGVTTSNVARLTFNSDADTASRTWAYHFTYRVL